MKSAVDIFGIPSLLAFLLCGTPLAAKAQLVITNGVQVYSALTNVTVTMSNRCELQVTSGGTPLSGCTVNLNSVDSYLVLPGIKPSVAAGATYMNQVKINGAAAVVDSNCRVVEYAMGAIVLPHSSSFQPMTIYSGPNFTGASMVLSQWSYYKSGLGSLYANISSFKLKRGYMAVMAQAENGTGVSKTYIAQDGDMEVSLLPSTLDHSIRFVYVTPWRWISKKSIAGWPGNVIMPSVQSWYAWRENHSSTRDLEYTAMQWGLFLPNLDNYNWQSQQINTVLGYNEPDHSDQSSMSVSDGITFWPTLQATGLRLGSPAVAQGGDWWFSPFMSQADSAGLRVDFVTIHDYACHDPTDPAGAAAQLYSYLKGYYDAYHRPIWLTEWNSGASGFADSCGTPTAAQEQALIAAMIQMMDNTPWIERYCIYNWVGSTRAVVDGSGNLTLAGQTYAAQQSPVGYVQSLQDNGTRSFSELRFETNTLDASGYGNNGIAAGSPAYTNGVHGQAMVFDGTNTFVTLPANIATSSGFTFAAWIKWNGGANLQRIFDFGNSMSEYMYLTPNSGSGLRFTIKDINLSDQSVQAPFALPINSWVHVAVTLNGSTAILYTNGIQAASSSVTYKPSDFNPRINALGRCSTNTSPATVPFFKGQMDDVFIADNALSATAIAELVTNAPPQFTANLIDGGSATEGVAYSGSIAGMATDADGQVVGYSKVNGPAWLSIASNGAMTGTPTAADGGTNYFNVTVTDSAGGGPGQHSYATVAIVVATVPHNSPGVWTADVSANWGDTTRWSGGTVAWGAGQTADFSTVNISANRTVTLETSRTIGTLKFNDTSGSQSWTLANSGSSALTLNSGSSTLPTVEINNPVTITAPLAGTNGFNKTGSGTLTLSGNNLYLSGTMNVAQGAVAVGNTYALGTGLLTMNGGAISNASGSYLIDNQINVASASTFGVASGATLQLSGVITNSGGFTKEGSGTLMLAGASTYAGTTTVNAGTLDISGYGSTPLGNSTLVINGGSIDNSVIRQSPLTANNPQVWNGDFSFIGTQDLDLGSGAVTLNGVRQVTISAGTLSLGGVIGGSGGLIKVGAGILYLYGTADSTYFGGMTLSAGELQISDSQALGTGGATFNGGTISARGGNRSPANAVTVGGNFTLNGANAGGNLLTLAGTVNLGGSTRTITVNASGGAKISGIISNGGITKSGADDLSLSAANTYSNDTRITAGSLTLANSAALQNSTLDASASDSGSLSFGSLTAATFGGLKGSRNLSLLNASSSAVSLTVGGNGQSTTYAGSLSGSGGLTKSGPGTLTLTGTNTFTGPASISTGGTLSVASIANTMGTVSQIGMGGGGSTGTLLYTGAGETSDRILSLTGGLGTPGAVIDQSGSGLLKFTANLSSPATISRTLTLQGSTSGNGEISGVIPNGSSTTSLMKAGAGTWTLSGANTYTGSTTVSNGRLLVNGSIGGGTVTVQSGGTLGGNGTIGGAITVQGGGTLSPGLGIGALTASSSVTLQAGSTNLMEISKIPLTNDQMHVAGTLALGGALVVTNLGGTLTLGDSFQLFIAGSYVGAFSVTNLPPLNSGLSWNFNGSSGVLSVVATVATNPTNITASISGNTLTLTWPADHTGWTLQAQTNALDIGLNTNWFNIVGSTATNQLQIPMDASAGSVFYRLVYP